MPLATGTRLGPYEIQAAIGAGGMGEVYRARDTRLGRAVAIKILPPALAGDAQRRRRFEQEARAVAALNHPHICTLYDVGHEGEIDFLVMEHLEGRTLAHVLHKRPLPLPQLLTVATQVADALAAAHARHIIHRDLKPSNIIITEQGGVKILDFGIAKLREVDDADSTTAAHDRDSLTGEGCIVGTVAYMSPEQSQGTAVDHRSDIFSLGVVLYEMASGARPLKGGDWPAVLSSVPHDVPPLVSDVNPAMPIELARIIRRCLQKDPERRYQSAKDLRNELAELTEESGSGDRVAASTDTRPARVRGTRKWRWAVASGGVLFGAALLGYLAWSGTFPAPGRSGSSAGETNSLGLGIPTQVTVAPGWENEPAISPDGSLVAYSSNQEGEGGIWLAGSHGGTAVHLAPGPGVDEQPAWFPDGSAIAFASNRGGRWNVWKVPVLGGSPTVVVENATDPAVSPDGERIAFVRPGGGGDDRIHVAPLLDPSKAYPVTRGGGPELMGQSSPAWSPDGKWICYVGDRSLWVVDCRGGQPRPLTNDREFDIEPAWSGDGRTIFFSSYRGGVFALWQVAVSGGPARRLTNGPGPERHPSVSRDGSQMAFSTFTDQYDLILHDLRSGVEDKLVTTRSERQPVFFHSGRAVVFTFDTGAGGANELWVQAVSGARFAGQMRRLTDFPGGITHPVLSPDDRFVAFQRSHGGSRTIWIAPSAGGRPVQFTSSPGDSYHPAWSPEGGRIAFVSSKEGATQVWVAPVSDGRPAGRAQRITSMPGVLDEPTWSPDGTWIALLAEAGAGTEVWVTKADGSGSPRCVTSGAHAEFVQWTPTSTNLVVSGLWDEGVLSLRRVDPATGAVRPFSPPLRIGHPSGAAMFDVSGDGRLVVFSRAGWTGDIWVSQVLGSRQ